MLEPDKRLGCDELGGFKKLKSHEFFNGINWDHIEETKPPELVPYLPATSSNPEQCWSTMKVSISLCYQNVQENSVSTMSTWPISRSVLMLH